MQSIETLLPVKPQRDQAEFSQILLDPVWVLPHKLLYLSKLRNDLTILQDSKYKTIQRRRQRTAIYQ